MLAYNGNSKVAAGIVCLCSNYSLRGLTGITEAAEDKNGNACRYSKAAVQPEARHASDPKR